MPLLTEQEIYELADDGVFLGNVKEITRAIEAKVIEKIKAQGPDMLYHGRCVVDCGEHGHADVELLKLIPAKTKLYRLPEGN